MLSTETVDKFGIEVMHLSRCCKNYIQLVDCVHGDYYVCTQCGIVTEAVIVLDLRKFDRWEYLFLNPIDFFKAQKWLVNDEGLSHHVYTDTEGNLTTGIGFNLKWGFSVDECVVILQMRMLKIFQSLKKEKPVFNSISSGRQFAIVNMAYQMGVESLLSFTNMWAAIEKNNWTTASAEALKSEWATKYQTRSDRIAYVLEHDNFSALEFKSVKIPEITLALQVEDDP